jgi:hypothetical protein
MGRRKGWLRGLLDQLGLKPECGMKEAGGLGVPVCAVILSQLERWRQEDH